MNYLFAAILGTVQGLTEFLPVSSSAHLILARAFFGWDATVFGLSFDVACHVGTLTAILYYFRAEIRGMIKGIPLAIRDGSESGRPIRLIVVATIPAIIFGLLMADRIEVLFRTPLVCAVALSFGALAMVLVERIRQHDRSEWELTNGQALALGCTQAVAFFPGVSRSGAVITLALFLGLQREAGARFAFLLGIPVILLAALRTGSNILATDQGVDLILLAIGAITSALVGYATIKYFLGYLARNTLDAFAVYRLVLAVTVIVWLVV